MFKALLKKQWLGLLAFFLQGKNGKRRSKGAAIGFAVLMIYAFGVFGIMFFELSKMLCEPLLAANLGWVYFALIGTIATCFGIVGGVFMAKSRLYEAKDNDLLFSMPIPSWMILFCRMLGLYILTFVFEAIIFVPALIEYFLVAGVTILPIFCGVVILFVMPLGAMSICCLLGFLLSWLTAKLPYKNFFTIVGFAVFMVVYFLLYSKMQEYLGYILANGEAVGSVMKTFLYPFSQVGYAAQGNVLALLIFVLIFGGLFAVTYWLLSATYFRVATTKYGERYAKYKEHEQKAATPMQALFKREVLHFIKSPMYLLNASMGTLIMLIMGVMMVIHGNLFGLTPEVVASMGVLSETMVLLVSFVVCIMGSSNIITACSVSLEGTNISLVQSLPVSEWLILKAKMYLHLVMTVLPALLCSGVMAFVTHLVWWETGLVLLTAVVASVLFAALGLLINLKFPSLHWTNETAAVKQSVSTVVAMFGGWGVALLPLGGYFLFGKYLPSWGYAAICLVGFAIAAYFICMWLKKRGTKIFKELSA